MKLQVNDSGAWRNVVSFEPERKIEVATAGAALLQAAGSPKTTMRICDGDQVVARCGPPAFNWWFE